MPNCQGSVRTNWAKSVSCGPGRAVTRKALKQRHVLRASAGATSCMYRACSTAADGAVTGAQVTQKSTRRTHQQESPTDIAKKACLPGLTADTTVFAIGRKAEMKVRKARRQGIASRGVPWKFCLLHRGTECLRRETYFVRRCLKTTGR